MNKKKQEPNKEDENVQRQVRLIHRLANRLPWIVVIVVLLAVITTIIQIYLSS
jgi:hypothetical protein